MGVQSNDELINVRDQDSNADNISDFQATFVTFRTSATDSDSNSLLEYGTGTQISTFKISNPDVTSMNASSLLNKYKFVETVSSLPTGSSMINVTINSGNGVPLRTPDQRLVFLVTGSPCYIYIKYSDSLFYKYEEDSSLSISTNQHVVWTNAHNNEISLHQISLETRKATNDDTDFDGLKNNKDPDSADRDTDDDGKIDSLDPDPTNPDCDGDGLSDGLELGITQTVPGIGTDIDGTNTSKTFTWTVNGFNVVIHNFTADADPTTVTDPKNADTDGDGIPDGIEDCDMTNLSLGNHTLKSTDLNGKYDGPTLSETNPLDKDTDDDGLNDGVEDTDHDGRWDWNNQSFTGETCSWRYDSDGDGLGDGLETGKTLSDIKLDTNTSIFRPDLDPTTTTNPLNLDSDFDGVPDGWIDGWTMTADGSLGKYNVPDMSFQFGEGEDKNLNGKIDAGETNPNSRDSDGDHLADGWDILSSDVISTLFTIDNSGVRRYWGELNSTTHYLGTRGGIAVYQVNTTGPTNIDSDGDGLVDGNVKIGELECELTTSHYGHSQGLFTDPSMQDSDEDGLSDGLEIAGWEVHILRESTKEEVKNWTTHSNPTIVDSDSDGVNDYYEFENQSDPQLSDTDGDYILDGDELPGALTQIDGTPPEIIKYSDGTQIQVSVKAIYSNTLLGQIQTGMKLVVTVHVKDPAGLKYVRIMVEGQDAKKFNVPAGIKEGYIALEFDFDVWRSLGGGYNINVTVEDRNGNGNWTTTHIDGLVEGVIKALVSAFMAFVEAVKELASALFDWIWQFIRSILKPIEDGFYRLADSLFGGFIRVLAKLSDSIINIDCYEGGKNNKIPSIFSELHAEFIKLGEAISIIMITVLIIQVVLGITKFSGLGGIITTVISTIITFIISKVISEFTKGLSSLIVDLFMKVPIPSSEGKSWVDGAIILSSLIIAALGLIITLIDWGDSYIGAPKAMSKAELDATIKNNPKIKLSYYYDQSSPITEKQPYRVNFGDRVGASTGALVLSIFTLIATAAITMLCINVDPQTLFFADLFLVVLAIFSVVKAYEPREQTCLSPVDIPGDDLVKVAKGISVAAAAIAFGALFYHMANNWQALIKIWGGPFVAP
jgi:hypothetical protein